MDRAKDVEPSDRLARVIESETIPSPAGLGVMTLVLLLLAMLVLTVAGTMVLTAWAILHPPRMTDGKAVYLLKRLSPGDLNVPWEQADFTVRDDRTGRTLMIAGWWMPHPAGANRTVVFLHGYADAKVGSIAWAPTWQSLGWNILAVDLRAHGQSEGGCITGGVFEASDIDQVINQLRATHAGQVEHLALLGISYGAAVALAVVERRDDVQAVVLECPFARFSRALHAHATMMQMPLPALMPATIRIAEWISGARFDAIEPARSIRQFRGRLMIVLAENDPFVDPDDVRELKQAVAERPVGAANAVVWEVPESSHLMALSADAREYQRRLGEFLAGV